MTSLALIVRDELSKGESQGGAPEEIIRNSC
jgi:hypothetical protein